MPSIPEDELLVKILGIKPSAGGFFQDYLDQDDEDEIKKAIRQYAAEEKLAERKKIALDNYHGHTFSDATNYKHKFDKFIEGNERRIKQLKEGI